MASIRTRVRKDGITAHTVVWRDPENGLKSRTFTDSDRAQELKQFLDANDNTFRLAAESKRAKDQKVPTVVEALTMHVEKLRDIDESSRADYRRKIGHHVQGTTLGGTPVDRVTDEHVTAWMDALSPVRGKGPMAPKTKKNIHSLLSAALARQVDAGTIRTNPAKGLAPKVTSPEREAIYLSPEAVDRLVKLTPAPHRLLVRTLASTGIRWGEATALQPRHVQIRRDGRVVLQVRQAWKRGSDSATRLGDPKTPKSVRDVACTPELSKALREHLDRDAEWLFTNGAGGPVLNANFNRDTWPLLADAMVAEGFTWERPQVKALRHSHCTHLLDAGVRVDVVQKRLGHESPATTLGVYARMTQDDDIAAADAVG